MCSWTRACVVGSQSQHTFHSMESPVTGSSATVEPSSDTVFWTEFIDLYKSYPCLWMIKSKEYSNRDAKTAAYNVLIEKMKEKNERANRETVTKKINSMRSSFRKEMKKVTASRKSGAAADDIYHPRLWYYHLLLFLQDQEDARESVTNISEVSLCNYYKYRILAKGLNKQFRN